jgi:hypothetical protein
MVWHPELLALGVTLVAAPDRYSDSLAYRHDRDVRLMGAV